nr:MAG TPA_asm: HicB-like toxin [Caudoviricetes sp.]
MKLVYPVIMSKTEKGILVYVPAFDCNTEGKDYCDAINMARDVISLMAIDYEDDGKELPTPDFEIKAKDGEIITLVDVDLLSYRKKYDNKAVRKNCTIPNWLNVEAERQHINFSAVLQEALQEKLEKLY